MKISTSQLFDNSVNQMNRQQSKIAEMQAKLASGKQIVKPSDDSEKIEGYLDDMGHSIGNIEWMLTRFKRVIK